MSAAGTVVDVQYHGATSRWQVEIEDGINFAAAPPDPEGVSFGVGDAVRLAWSAADAVPLAEP
jgi:putative spermidine/putrescine transport system ATP-binding protein